MAHNLEIVNGKASMAYVGETPWHGLGERVSNDISVTEMMEKSGANFKVLEKPSFVMFNGKKIETGMKALVRDTDGRVLTQVGKGWHPVQNEEAFNFFREYTEAGDMEMHTAGVLKDGEIVWVLAKVKDSFSLFKGDKVDSYLLFTNPHQYGKTIDIRFSPIRVVCNNTLTLALKGKSDQQVRLDHRRSFDAESVKETLGIAGKKMKQYKEMAQFLGSKRTTDETLREYFGALMGESKKKEGKLSRTGERAMEVITSQPGANFAEGSWWQALNAVTYMTDHKLGRTVDTRLQSAWYGANRKLKLEAVELALEMAEKAPALAA